MTVSRRARSMLVVAFLALLIAGSAQDVHARLSIFWRGWILSWDCPLSQAQDELAVQGVAYTDAARQARAHTRPAVTPSERLAAPPQPVGADDVARSSPGTRAPPLV